MKISHIFVLALSFCFAWRESVSKGVPEDVSDDQLTRIMNKINPANIRENLRHLTEYPHHPGSPRNTLLAKQLANVWREQGFDKTEIYPYNILLSYPVKPGEISLRENGKVARKFVIHNEPPVDDTERKGEPLFPFNAFSPSGRVTAPYVYVAYGRESDFKALVKLGVVIKGKIVIARYGRGYRGGKVKAAERYGAVGVILYSDPYDYTYPGQQYPEGWMLNRDGIQRGTINRLTGDALSLGYPSKPNYYRKPESKYTGQPIIPSQPISYGTAYEILSGMRGDDAPLPEGFQGHLNFTYVLTSGVNQTLTLQVSTKTETRESLTVCTSLYGQTEPDRYIMIGNHRDSWTYGAADPSSGTATMMEIVRVLGSAHKETGWRPRRSVMACSWGAEETGVQGSTEWADENHEFIKRKVVGYLNVDMAVEGNYTLRMKNLKFLSSGMYRIAKLIQAPDNAEKTLYEDWHDKSKVLKDKPSLKEPSFVTPSAGSDYKAFWHTYGTTIADMRYLYSKKEYPRVNTNGHYHTRYESFGWMSKYVDPEFKYHTTVGKLWSGYALVLAESPVIPYDLVTYATQLKYFFGQFKSAYGSMLARRNISLKFLRERLNALSKKCEDFHRFVNGLTPLNSDPYKMRSINDKLMNFERNFLLQGMISKRRSARHVVYSTGSYKLKRTKFPGISEAIFRAVKGRGGWDEVRKQITLVVWCVDTANKSLDVDEWNV